jgi:hypothetical protein
MFTVPPRGLSEDLEIGRYPLNDGPRIDSKILGIKLTDTGFLVRFSADLTEILSDYLAESLQPLPYTIDDISGSLVVDIRAGRDRDLGQRLSSLISHLTQQNCADRFAEGKGSVPMTTTDTPRAVRESFGVRYCKSPYAS